MTFLFWSAIYLYSYLTVKSDSDWRAIPLIFLFMAALSLAMVDLWPAREAETAVTYLV